MKLQDKVIVITGGARGLGKAIALELAKQGAHIALIDMNTDDLKCCADELSSLGVKALPYVCNVADEASVERTFDAIIEDFGCMNGLVNNAGILRDGLLVKAKGKEVESVLSLQQWQQVIDVNLTGVFLCGRAAASRMIQGDWSGCIVNISSVARAGNVGQSNYSAAKAGVVALSTTWAKELARYNIRSMAVAPGFIETDMTNTMPDHAKAHLSKVIPLGHPGQPAHIASSVLHIFENDYLSGRVIEVDGALRV